MYQFHQEQIKACDEQIEFLLEEQTKQTGQNDLAYEPEKKKPSHKNAPTFDVGKFAYQLSDGIDLMQIKGVGPNLILAIGAEVGFDLATSFPSAKNFTSWMSLSPNKRITGGKVLSSKSNKNKSRLAQAFRKAANAVGRKRDTPLSDFFRRIAYRKGRKVAITATARKLAVIVYHMLVDKQAYRSQDLEEYRQRIRDQKVRYLQKTIKQLEIKSTELEFS